MRTEEEEEGEEEEEEKDEARLDVVRYEEFRLRRDLRDFRQHNA